MGCERVTVECRETLVCEAVRLSDSDSETIDIVRFFDGSRFLSARSLGDYLYLLITLCILSI